MESQPLLDGRFLPKAYFSGPKYALKASFKLIALHDDEVDGLAGLGGTSHLPLALGHHWDKGTGSQRVHIQHQ